MTTFKPFNIKELELDVFDAKETRVEHFQKEFEQKGLKTRSQSRGKSKKREERKKRRDLDKSREEDDITFRRENSKGDHTKLSRAGKPPRDLSRNERPVEGDRTKKSDREYRNNPRRNERSENIKVSNGFGDSKKGDEHKDSTRRGDRHKDSTRRGDRHNDSTRVGDRSKDPKKRGDRPKDSTRIGDRLGDTLKSKGSQKSMGKGSQRNIGKRSKKND
eukprot:CAMPEP_0205816402 /NCGR_PEP_ID=MMETSP0205-20121125/22666_1 /ASSEMBLY_ACC=CAM_ASM_000278 /TAXON_ID=36767 /ORGANISM="Euplotes focardii, Strain TN1" /LENGTH=217 /DNA_ID=CAMNT_0053104665 /DNA_START=36 /DNA_END=686 /DNA_ORIENTATION=+